MELAASRAVFLCPRRKAHHVLKRWGEDKGRECGLRCFSPSYFGVSRICMCVKLLWTMSPALWCPESWPPNPWGNAPEARVQVSKTGIISAFRPALSEDTYFLKEIGFILYLLLMCQSPACGVWSYYQGREKKKKPHFTFKLHFMLNDLITPRVRWNTM